MRRTNKTYKKYGYLEDRYSCVYCGELADTVDHVPPVQISNNLDLEMTHMLVPACRECNSTLTDKFLLHLDERAEHLLHRYKKKYKKHDSVVAWDEEEIEELSGSLQTYIRGCQLEYQRFRERISHLRQRILISEHDLELLE